MEVRSESEVHYYVYLETSSKRLMIVDEPKEGSNFKELVKFKSEGTKWWSHDLLKVASKLFCQGYIMGAGNDKPINEFSEFQ